MKRIIILMLSWVFSFQVYGQMPGSLDSTWNFDGVIQREISLGTFAGGHSVYQQVDGKLIIVGNDGNNTVLLRYFLNGELDTLFGQNGKCYLSLQVPYNTRRCLSFQSDGKMIIGGQVYTTGFDTQIALTRLHQSGVIDSTFGVNGLVIFPTIQKEESTGAILVQADDKIVLTGTTYSPFTYEDIVLLRFQSNGFVDSTFGVNGLVIHNKDSTLNISEYGTGVALQPDGKMIVCGYSEYSFVDNFFLLTRYNSDGILDSTFGYNGRVETRIADDNRAYDVLLQSDDKIIVGGTVRFVNSSLSKMAIARYHSDGSPDSSFNGTGQKVITVGGQSYGYSLLLQPDNKILISGFYHSIQNRGITVVRCNSDGEFDNAFGGDGVVFTGLGGLDNVCYSSFLQSDGKIVLCGYVVDDGNPYHSLLFLTRYHSGLQTDIQDGITTSPLIVYPNPASDRIEIKNKGGLPDITELGIYDIMGNEWCRMPSVLSEFPYTQGVVISDLPNGVYVLRIKGKSYWQTELLRVHH